MRRVHQAVSATVIALAVFSAFATAPASADHQEPFDGHEHYYGEMVDYPLVFPVGGDSYWYEDWFWAQRSNGLHHAQDFMAPKMTPVFAVASGTVTYINWSQDPNDLNPDRCCNLVILHDDGWQSWYIHLNNDTPGTDDGEAWGIAPGIELGVHVEAGTLIGWVGDSGNAEDTPPHLHFELYDPEGVLVNPYDSFLAAEGQSFCAVKRFAEIDALVETPGLVQRGAVGTAVEQLQEALFVLGFDPSGIDGAFGPLTEGAVRGFQDERGLSIDGIVGSQTKGTLAQISEAAEHIFVLDPDGRNLSMGALGGDVRELQHLLGSLGLDAGPADGVFGSKTAGAVRAYQEGVGILIDGVVGPGTRLSMASTLGLSRLISCPSQ
jgi:peptidoglycan hydrolase-like protein with peptidoglycan-binding domain